MDAEALRAEFPVLQRLAYLNAGTDGPLPARAVAATKERLEHELRKGRSGSVHWDGLEALSEATRERLAVLLGASADEVALTRSATDGMNLVLSALELGSKDEVLTTDEEHPGLLAPLAALARRTGAAVRVAPFDQVADAIAARPKLIAVSHISWMTGRRVAVEALRDSGIPLLLDGAQGLGAVPVNVRALGCAFYAVAAVRPGRRRRTVRRARVDRPPRHAAPGLRDDPRGQRPAGARATPRRPLSRRRLAVRAGAGGRPGRPRRAVRAPMGRRSLPGGRARGALP